MTTRLDRLFLLLDTGSTPLIRKSAAQQLGEVQKLHPYELNNLLSKVHGYLQSSSWETRIAAGQAIEAIARNVPQWEPRGSPKLASENTPDYNALEHAMFSHFNLVTVLSHGSSLLGSEGGQYELDKNTIGMDDKEQLARQRQMLNKRLGLDFARNLKLGMDRDLFTDEDLMADSQVERSERKNQIPVAEIVKNQLLDVSSGMSARERNRAKRRAKLVAKQKSRDAQSDSAADTEPTLKRAKTSCVETEDDGEDGLVIDNGADNTFNADEVEDWPFEGLCELFMHDMFHSSWEVRHGATTGLREVIKLHGRGAGKSIDTPADQMSGINQLWLSDLALLTMCVLALDRFGDFVSDEVVAPVRETCAQTLGVIMKFLNPVGVQGVMKVLLQLLSQYQWEVRHGGLLGFKYLFAVRQDMTPDLLPIILPSVFLGLQDVDDDVRAVAAAALVPVTDILVRVLPQQVPIIVGCLWETLLDLDDLTASTNSIMTLLSTLLSHPQAAGLEWLCQPLTDLVPRLWPFFRHNIASVRKSALETLYTLLSIESAQHSPNMWLPLILQDTLRHIYQRSLLEQNSRVLDVVQRVWTLLLEKAPIDHLIVAAVPWLGVWLSLAMQPVKIPFDQTYLTEAKHKVRDPSPSKPRPLLSQQLNQPAPCKEQRDYIAGFETLNDPPAVRDTKVVRARMYAASLLGLLCSYITREVPNFPPEAEKPVDSLAKLFNFHFNSKSAVQRFVVAQVIYQWASLPNKCLCPCEVTSKLLDCLNEAIYFDEIAVAFTRMQTDCRDFINSLKQEKIDMDAVIPPGAILSLEQASALCSSVYEKIKSSLRPRVQASFDQRCQQLFLAVTQTNTEQGQLTVRVQCSLAKAVVLLDALPEKLTPVIRPLMECVKKEENHDIQAEAAKCLSQLIQRCLSRTPCPNSKVIKNLCSFLCCDPAFTPNLKNPAVNKNTENDNSSEPTCHMHSGILILTKLQKTPEVGRKWYKRSTSIKTDVHPDDSSEDTENKKQLKIQRLGAETTLMTVAQLFGENIPRDVPTLWESIMSAFDNDQCKEMSEAASQELIASLQVLEAIGPALHSTLCSQVMKKLPSLYRCLKHPYTSVRHMAARCIGMLSRLVTAEVMRFLIEDVLPMLGSNDCTTERQGAAEAIFFAIDCLGMDIVSYIVLLIVPILGRMSDQNDAVRLMASHCFATLIRLMPLEAGIPDPPEMNERLVKQKEKERVFLEQLMDCSKMENYKLEIPIAAELRKYQQDGVNWLAFLNKYHLHGILCDDMGLGKTLQSICILANDTHRRAQIHKETENPDSVYLPSIVVCPPTLIGHWVYEVKKFVDEDYLNPLMYAGPPFERLKLQKKVQKHNLIVASYDVVRNDIDFFSTIKWNYCILDEGHIIKNGKTKLSKAVKQLTCNHRLILSGTPIQNNVIDLWSLFDFLMPGFLGTEKQFQARYGKPILQSRDAKSTSREQEAGALAMESLHRQVLPFILRRLKEDVLNDLPPKIIQDYYCDLSSLQMELYEDFARSRAKQGIDDTVTGFSGEADTEKPVKAQDKTHIFQALQYLRKVCNHPALVLTPSHPKYEDVTSRLKQQNTSLYDVQHASKLVALRQLLTDCGIGVSAVSGDLMSSDIPVVNQHRVLLFCQLKSMLDIVERDLLKKLMTNVTYLRLDGSIPAASRHDIVNRFNNDPSIDILLLTTHVGGLGLNLTGADTVIFVEHDWNPMKDLQAMDRAHRIGQKKVVNVYRLVTRGTLEEKIMGLQKFKITIANTVISQENSSLQTMSTDQLLDLFSLDDSEKGQVSKRSDSSNSGEAGKESIKSILDNLGDLWDEKQYEKEYNLDSFMTSLDT